MLPSIIVYFLLLLSAINLSESANILYLIPYAEKSHYIMLRPIGLELARRGHNVTVITSFKESDHPPNYHQVVVADDDEKPGADATVYGTADGQRFNLFDTVDMSMEDLHWKLLWSGGLALTEKYLQSKQLSEFLRTENKFDLVISEQFAQESFYILAHKYNAPLVLVSTFGNVMKHNFVTRNPLQLATVVYEWGDIDQPTSFIGRLKNLYYSWHEYFWWRFWFLDQHEMLMKKYIPNLPEPVPSLYQMQQNVSLMLINSHFSFENPTAYLPNIVEIGGAHLSRSDNALPEDLKTILDKAEQGVVYVSFGSNIQSSELPQDKKNVFLNVFGRLKQTVLWKWEDDVLENKPDNLVIRKWFPQKEVLAHPNVKVFLSHGGLIGTQEAIFNGVPIIGIPVCVDQFNNLLQAQEIGFGKVLRYHETNEINLEKMLSDVLNDDKYRTKAHEISIRFKDRPLSALDTAVFWIEYVIRNNGAGFMRNPALSLDWFAYNMLDVYAFILFIIFVLVVAVAKTISILLWVLNINKKRKQKRS